MSILRRQHFHVIRGGIGIALTLGLFACQPQPSEVANPPTPTTTPSVEPSASPPATPTSVPATPSPAVTDTKIQVYWLQDKDSKLELVPALITLVDDGIDTPTERLTAAVERLLTGSANADMTSAIPEATKLNKLTIKEDGVHIDLNQEFTTGGGSASMQGRLGQVVYTASMLNPQEKIWLSIEGEPLEVLGGEGLLVSQPMTRQEFDQEFSL